MSAMCLLFAVVFFSVVPAKVQAQSSQEAFNQYVADHQKNPSDTALREKIIKLAQEMKPAPAIPEDAERFMVRGSAAIKGAKTADDFKDAVAEFEKATLAAPWLADAYYNLGVAQDKAGQYESALKSLNFYLMAAPNAPDAKVVKSLIYEVEYRRDKAAKESSPEAVAAQDQNKGGDWLKKLDGRRYTCQTPGGTAIIDVKGKVFVFGVIINGRYSESSQNSRIEIEGRETRKMLTRPVFNDQIDVTEIISEDGDRITARTRYANGTVGEDVYLWQR